MWTLKQNACTLQIWNAYWQALKKAERICIVKHDKGRGVVVMDNSKYAEKCLQILQTQKYTKLRHDPTKSI